MDNTVFTFRYEGDNAPSGGQGGQPNPLHIISPAEVRRAKEMSIEMLRAAKISATEALQDRKRRAETRTRVNYGRRMREAREGGATDDELDQIRIRRGNAVSRIKRAYDIVERRTVQHYDQLMRTETRVRADQMAAQKAHDRVVLSRIKQGHKEQEAEQKKADQKAVARAGRRRRLLRSRGRKQRRRAAASETSADKKAAAYAARRSKVLAARSKATRDRADRNSKNAQREAEKRSRQAIAGRKRQHLDESSLDRQEARDATYARIAGRIFRTYLVREFGGHRAGRINAAGEAAQEASMRIGDTALGRTLAVAGTLGKAIGTATAVANVAYEISKIPERLANFTRSMSTASGGPSLERIESMSPAAAVARARQNATAAMGALESSRIIGEASRRRIEADTKLAEASRKASDNLFVRATPIYELYQGAKTGIVSVFAGQAGVENGFRDRVVGENAVVASLRRQIEETIQKAFFPGQQKERSDALESWAKGLAADAAKKGSLRSLFMFQEKWLKPLEYPEFENGLPQAGTMERVPPVWVEEGLEFN